MLRNFLWGIGCFFLLVGGGAGFGRGLAMVSLEGRTMGTTWHVRCVPPASLDGEGLKALLENELAALNASMSAFMPESTLSRFNRMKASETLMPDPLFARVLAAASDAHRITGGAFDPTVLPLVNLWGFGPDGYRGGIPAEGDLEAAKKRVGFEKLIFYGDGRIGKKEDGVMLDLGAIAKGFGVDVLAATLEGLEVRHYLVEIGGEVRAAGCRADGRPWRVGISRPAPGAAASDIFLRLDFCRGALATSGDYRNFFESGGRRFSHVMDPVKGAPVDTGIISASVRHDTCMMADALATAIMVMGMEAARKMVLEQEGVEALIVRETGEKMAESWMSPGFVEKAP